MKNYLLAAIASFLFLLSCSENSTNSNNQTGSDLLLPMTNGNTWIYSNNKDDQTMKWQMEDVGSKNWHDDNNFDVTHPHPTFIIHISIDNKQYEDVMCYKYGNEDIMFGTFSNDGVTIIPGAGYWKGDINDKMWISKEDLTLNSKTYKDCLKHLIEGNRYEWLKKGVGFVQMDYTGTGKRWFIKDYTLH